MPGQPFLHFRVPQGQADELGEIEHREIIVFAGLPGDALLGQVQVGLAHLAGDHETFGPGLQGPVIEALHQGVDDVRPGHGQAGPAAVCLVGPVQGRGPQDLEKPLQVLRVLAVALVGNAGRPGHQAAVIAHGLEPFQGFGHLLRQDLQEPILADKIQQVPDLDVAAVRRAQVGPFAPQQGLFRHLEAVETEGAGGHHVLAGLFRQGQVAGRQGDGNLMIDAVGRAGPAAVPVLDFLQLQVQQGGGPGDGGGVIQGGPLQRTTGIIGDFHGLDPRLL